MDGEAELQGCIYACLRSILDCGKMRDKIPMHKKIPHKAGFLSSVFQLSANYIDSVKVREITSACCSGVRELKRTA